MRFSSVLRLLSGAVDALKIREERPAVNNYASLPDCSASRWRLREVPSRGWQLTDTLAATCQSLSPGYRRAGAVQQLVII